MLTKIVEEEVVTGCHAFEVTTSCGVYNYVTVENNPKWSAFGEVALMAEADGFEVESVKYVEYVCPAIA